MDKRRDRLRNLIHLSIEAYNTAADPPCIDYARNTEPVDRLEYIPTNRQTLLRIGIDVKHTLLKYCQRIPEKRAETLINWIAGGSNVADYALSDYQRLYLKADRKALQYILKDKGYR
jgi:hypothetical protein